MYNFKFNTTYFNTLKKHKFTNIYCAKQTTTFTFQVMCINI
jgi:hypothetical protein